MTRACIQYTVYCSTYTGYVLHVRILLCNVFSGMKCYYAGIQTYGSCLVSISNPMYAGFIAATVPACTTADYAGTTTGSDMSTTTDCLVQNKWH